MKPQAALAAVTTLVVALAATLAPALAARGSYVIDDAHMLSSGAIAQINQQVGDFNAQTGKEVLVVTTDSLNGQPANAALERSFAQNQVNGVEIFIAKNEKQIKIAGDVASRRFFPSGSFDTIYQAMKPSFVQGNFDQGVETGVGLILNTYRGHESSLNRGRVPAGAGAGTTSRVQHNSSGGSGLGWIWWIIILAVIFFVIRGIFRAMSGPRMYGGGAGYGPGPGYGPGYGGYGGGMGGGGGFWSGLLGGLGGAWLGNELFGGRRDYGGGDAGGGSWAGTGAAPDAGASDAGGWQSDAGQIDTGNVGGGGWGDSGGGDSGGGWGGGDGGGGGGDSGGGW